MKLPQKTCYSWISDIKGSSILSLSITLFFLYLSLNIFFGSLYYAFCALGIVPSLLDHYYFSFVTALTVGYGDVLPRTDPGKVLVILHTCLTTAYFGMMISLLMVKLFYPKNTIVFSRYLIIDRHREYLVFRILNTHREKLIHPEVRILLTRHSVGNVISHCLKVEKIDDITYLGKHDFNIHFSNKIKYNGSEIIISRELFLAKNHDRKIHDGVDLSRCKISISISGNYGIQQIATVHTYYPKDIKQGRGFKPINYTKEDQREKGNIRYCNFPNFWSDFNKIQ